MTSVDIQTHSGPVTMFGEAVDDLWVIVPSFTSDNLFNGQFHIAHRPTGLALPHSGCIECVRKSAALVAAIEDSWAPSGGGVYLTPEVKEKLSKAMRPILSCDCSGDCTDSHCADPYH